jgi:hypothetical protein
MNPLSVLPKDVARLLQDHHLSEAEQQSIAEQIASNPEAADEWLDVLRSTARLPDDRAKLKAAKANGTEQRVEFGELDESGAAQFEATANDDVVAEICRNEPRGPNEKLTDDEIVEMAGEFVGPITRRCLDVARCTDKHGAKLFRLETLSVTLGHQTAAEAAHNLGCTEGNVAQGVKAWREWFAVEFCTLNAHSPEARKKMRESARERWRRHREKKAVPILQPAPLEKIPLATGVNITTQVNRSELEAAA